MQFEPAVKNPMPKDHDQRLKQVIKVKIEQQYQAINHAENYYLVSQIFFRKLKDT